MKKKALDLKKGDRIATFFGDYENWVTVVLLEDAKLFEGGKTVEINTFECGKMYFLSPDEEIEIVETDGLSIKKLIIEAHQNAINHGWWEKPKTFGELISLVHSELSEALEEHRNGHEPTETYYSGKWKMDEFITIIATTKNSSALIYSPNKYVCENILTQKPEGIPSELADIVIRVFDICGYYGIDLESAILEKMKYNKTRPYKHGGKKL